MAYYTVEGTRRSNLLIDWLIDIDWFIGLHFSVVDSNTAKHQDKSVQPNKTEMIKVT